MTCLVASITAQQNEAVAPYYRNALTSMVIYHAEDEFGYEVCQIFDRLPKQEKYDNHPIGFHVIDNSKITGVKRKENGLHRQEYGKSMVLSAAEKRANGEGLLRLLNEADCGKRIVAKWFNIQGDRLENAYFNTEVIESRTDYNVTSMEAEQLRYTVEGHAALQDISAELISHSFVLISDMTYITAEDRAEAAKATMNVLGGIVDALTGGNSGQRMAEAAGDIADSFTGFKVFTHSYLYQLEWNDSLMNEFYTRYYSETPDQEKQAAFWADKSMFRMKYLGEESSVYEKTQKVGKYLRTELLELISARSIDRNIAALQSHHEDFQLKTPIIGVEYNNKGKLLGYRAPIGMKEGINDMTTFEVLEASVVKGKIKYTPIAQLRPVKNQIWDNRYNALMEQDQDILIESTLLKPVGAPTKEILPGMIIRLTQQKSGK